METRIISKKQVLNMECTPPRLKTSVQAFSTSETNK